MKHVTKATEICPVSDCVEFKVISATETYSKAGNEMISVVLDVNGYEVNDMLVESPKASWRIDQFLASLGVNSAVGEEIEIKAPLLVGMTGKCSIVHESQPGFPDKARPGNYIKLGQHPVGEEDVAF